jgi:hypothetical protein
MGRINVLTSPHLTLHVVQRLDVTKYPPSSTAQLTDEEEGGYSSRMKLHPCDLAHNLTVDTRHQKRSLL